MFWSTLLNRCFSSALFELETFLILLLLASITAQLNEVRVTGAAFLRIDLHFEHLDVAHHKSGREFRLRVKILNSVHCRHWWLCYRWSVQFRVKVFHVGVLLKWMGCGGEATMATDQVGEEEEDLRPVLHCPQRGAAAASSSFSVGSSATCRRWRFGSPSGVGAKRVSLIARHIKSGRREYSRLKRTCVGLRSCKFFARISRNPPGRLPNDDESGEGGC